MVKGSFPSNKPSECEKTLRTKQDNEIEVVIRLKEDPTVSARTLTNQFGVNRTEYRGFSKNTKTC